MNNLITAFSTDIYQSILKINLIDICKYSLDLQNKSKGRVSSNICGWQSYDLGYDIPNCIKDLKHNIQNHLNIFKIKMNINSNIELGNMWININEYKDSNITHSHPGSILSGVFYIKIPKNSGPIKFFNPFAEQINVNLKNQIITKYQPNNCSEFSIFPKENMLILFPSWLQHCVMPNMNKTKNRISISFNAK